MCIIEKLVLNSLKPGWKAEQDMAKSCWEWAAQCHRNILLAMIAGWKLQTCLQKKINTLDVFYFLHYNVRKS